MWHFVNIRSLLCLVDIYNLQLSITWYQGCAWIRIKPLEAQHWAMEGRGRVVDSQEQEQDADLDPLLWKVRSGSAAFKLKADLGGWGSATGHDTGQAFFETLRCAKQIWLTLLNIIGTFEEVWDIPYYTFAYGTVSRKEVGENRCFSRDVVHNRVLKDYFPLAKYYLIVKE